jgi:hypothetical protein
VFAHIGLIGDFNHTTGLASTFENQSYSTLDDRWTAGLRIRIPISTSEIGVSGRYGEQDFRMGVIPGSNAPPVPNYTYTFVQAGLDARLQLGIVAILADGAYMDVVDDGIAQSSSAANPAYFPHAQVGAVTTGLHLGFRLWDSLELRAGADYQRYFFSFNPEPGDAHVAGGPRRALTARLLASAIEVVDPVVDALLIGRREGEILRHAVAADGVGARHLVVEVAVAGVAGDHIELRRAAGGGLAQGRRNVDEPGSDIGGDEVEGAQVERGGAVALRADGREDLGGSVAGGRRRVRAARAAGAAAAGAAVGAVAARRGPTRRAVRAGGARGAARAGGAARALAPR